MSWRDQAIADIRRDEGCRLYAYQDGGGVWTIGYGHTRGVVPTMTCTLGEAKQWLTEDLWIAEQDLNANASWWISAPNPVKRGLLNMCFNLGWPRLSGFVKMLEAGANGNWAGMAAEVENSKYARQVGLRAINIAALFASASQMELAV